MIGGKNVRTRSDGPLWPGKLGSTMRDRVWSESGSNNESDGGPLWPGKALQRRFFLLIAAWVRSRAERPSVSYTKVTA